MTKQTKQKNSLRLRRRIRKTIGALSLASALAVATIPVDTLEAVENLAGDTQKVVLTEADSKIPAVNPATDPVYMTGDGVYSFAYVYPKNASSGDKIAVILEYNSNMDPNVSTGVLTIPDTVDAYKAYDPGTGTGSGNVAVNASDQYMFYIDETPILDEYGNYTYGEYQKDPETGDFVLDESGNKIPIESTLLTEKKVAPCYYRTINNWTGKDLYLLKSTGTMGSTDVADYQKVVAGSDDERLANIKVQYINNAKDGVGVFEEKGSIVTLNIGSNMLGIGDRAFYGCTSINSVEVGAGIDTIGNFAFANCINIQNFNIPTNTNVRIIGQHAFSNCQNLTSFVMPVSVEKLGDYCFENCYKLASIDLNGGGTSRLTNLGNHLFVNCKSLTGLLIPLSVNETLDISMIEGCESLAYVTVLNTNTTFTEGLPSVNEGGSAYSIAKFKNTVPAEFYFEGEQDSAIHKLCGANAIAFKYYGQDVYEIIIHETEGDLTSPKATYKVNSSNELILCDIESGMEVVDMPQTIGPAKIQVIASTGFQNNCFLEKVYIPSSVIRIENSAFQGCHNLKDVIFREPVNITAIGDNAFQTQMVSVHNKNCPNTTLAELPVLTFTGPISYSSVPFTYAMDPESNINTGSQTRTYITYYSGWPNNLTVQYDYATDKNVLLDYPTFATLSTDYDDMPYLTDAEKSALSTAYNNKKNGVKLTQDEEELINAVLNIELPQGIEDVADGLFIDKETNSGEDSLLNGLGLRKTLTTNSFNEIPANTFEGLSNVESIYIHGETYSIGDYAFKDCDSLKNVEISSMTSALGLRPFAGCENVSSISFQGGPYYVCENGIIYSLESGAKTGIAECLESRGVKVGSSTVEADELVGITSIAQEAFMDCPGIGSIDMTDSSIGEIPTDAFKNTSDLYSVYLPESCKAIWGGAFKESNVRYLEIPNSVSYIDPDAFDTSSNAPTTCKQITFFTEDSSNAAIYAKIYDNINVTQKETVITYTVYFMGMDGSVLDKQTVVEGDDAVPPEPPVIDGFTFTGWSPSYEAVGSDLNIVAQYEVIDPDSLKATVNFIDFDDTVIKTVLVEIGKDAEAPADPVREGYRFTGWRPAITNITEDVDIYAQYEKIDSDEYMYEVTFVDHDDTVLKVDTVDPGKDAEPPANPTRAGYIFTGWRPSYKNVTEDVTVYAQYEAIDSEDTKYTVRFIDHDDTVLYVQKVSPGENAITPQDPTRSGYKFTGWRPAITNITKDTDVYAQYEKIEEPSGGGNGDGTGGNGTGGNGNGGGTTPTPTPTPTTFYTLTVRNGSGSGSYAAGERVIIIADDPEYGKEFSNWSVDPSDTVIASKYVTATVIDMPAKDVLVTANYKTSVNSGVVGSGGNNNSGGGGSTGNSGSSGSSGGSGSSNSGNSSTNGTTVVINKNGLSNTGVVAVQVNGSSDNFVLKITEDKDATEEILKALMNKYTDISDIVYFPMDITLYDSTGTKKITDTTGLSIDITIPIPDSMITYAGNNKIAAVVNGKLQTLTPKFKTISGVSCISFTATHFSPYVIYVDTQNLTAGVISDSTPKTGDGIHPKWFASIGLACLGMVLFLKKDKVVKPDDKKVKMA